MFLSYVENFILKINYKEKSSIEFPIKAKFKHDFFRRIVKRTKEKFVSPSLE